VKNPSDEIRQTADAAARIDDVVARLAAVRVGNQWPKGADASWTDAFGLMLLVSLYRWTGDTQYIVEARSLVAAAEAVLRPREQSRLDLAAWILALGRLARVEPEYRRHAVDLAHRVHERFATRNAARRTDTASRTCYPSERNELETVELFLGYVAYRSLDEPGLSAVIADLREQIERSYRDLVVTRDLALGLMLWMTHLHPDEPWAELQRGRCLRVLEHLWVSPPGYFCREPGLTREKSALANHVISIGLQVVGAMPERVEKLRSSRARHSPDEPDDQGATLLLACCADVPGELVCAPARS
jgi:hypothetical protein